MMKKTWYLWSLAALFFYSHVHAKLSTPSLWYFELKLAHASVPFMIEFKEDKTHKLIGHLKNGKETIILNDITVKGTDLSIPIPPYEVTLELSEHSSSLLQGTLVRHNKNPKVETPVVGVTGPTTRFPSNPKTPEIDLDGRWAVQLTEIPEERTYPGVVIFTQKGNNLHGSILTPSGDYRYLEGQVSGGQFEAASFDGVYNYVVKGTLEKGKLKATINSNLVTKIEGVKDAQAQLPDAYSRTQIESLDFTFSDLSGKLISLKDPKFKNKPIIVQFFGSWCPNCIDEMAFFVPWYKANKGKGVEIIALAFERSLDAMSARTQLKKIQARYKLPYTLLLAGITSEDKPMDKIKGLKNFSAFPTTVYLNRKHEVVKVHSGFTGPSTGEFFENWKKEFQANIQEISKK